MIKVNYICPRCRYSATHRACMEKHLYKRKKECAALENDIELTDEIKKYILKNQVYKVPKEEKPKTIYQTINNNQYNYNTMNNYLNSLDIEDKFKKYIEYSKTDVLAIEFAVEEKYIKEIKRLKNDKYKYGMRLNQAQLLEIVDNISKVSDNFEDFNVLYDADMNKVKLYSKSWSPYLVETGVKKLVETIQDSYLYAYEMYLIKKIYDGKLTNYPELNKYKSSLEEYYKFMNIFDIEPYCVDKTDDEILAPFTKGETQSVVGSAEPTYETQDKIHTIYNNMKISKSETNKLKKTVLEIIKSNSKYNMKEFNKKLMDLLKMNEEFKEDLLKDLEINEEEPLFTKSEPQSLLNEILEEENEQISV